MVHLTKNIRVLKRKEVKNLLTILKEHWGFEEKVKYTFLIGKDDNIFIINKEISTLNLEHIRINSAGLYIGQLKGNSFRLSIEGSQIIGPKVKKNVLEINNKLTWLWIKGYDIPFPEEEGKKLKGYQILKNSDDYLGCGIFKENRILNFVPKARRLRVDE